MLNPRTFAIGAITLALFASSATAEYNPVVGRFLQRDPIASGLPIQNDPFWFNGRPPYIGQSMFDAREQYADGMNFYQYVGGNPVNRNDALGLEWDDFDEAIGGLYYDRIVAYGYTRDALAHAKRGAFLAQLYARMAFAWDDFVWDQNEAALFSLIAGPFFSTICFVEGTTVATPDGPERIEYLLLGREIVSQRDPQRIPSNDYELSAETDSIVLVRLEYCHTDGSTTAMEVLRPTRLVASLRLAPGCSLPVSLPEMGFAGNAEVIAVEPYFERIRHAVPVVTGRFVTDSAEVVNVFLDGFDDPIGVTPRHPMFSADRNTWIAASDLQPNERLVTLCGIAQVSNVERSALRAKVYNVEVSHNHTFFVGDAGVWAHNPCKLSADVRPRGNATSLKGARWPAVRVGADTVYVAASHGHARHMVTGGDGSQWVGRISVVVEEGFVEFLNAAGTAYRFVGR